MKGHCLAKLNEYPESNKTYKVQQPQKQEILMTEMSREEELK
jgi:hypothetical protein